MPTKELFTGQQYVGEAISSVGMLATGSSQVEREVQLLARIGSDIATSTTWMEASVNLLRGIRDISLLAYENELRRSSDQLAAFGGTLQAGRFAQSGGSQFKDLETAIERSNQLNEKEAAALPQAMVEMQRANPTGIDFSENTGKNRQLLTELVNVSNLLGESFVKVARDVGDFATKEGTSYEDMLKTFVMINQQGQHLAERFSDMGGIDIQKFKSETLKAQDALRPFGFSMLESTALVTAFSKELNDGIISLDDLVGFVTGVTKAGAGQRAFMGEQVMNLDPSKFGELQSIVGNMNVMARAGVMGTLARGEQASALYKDLGITKPEDIAKVAAQARAAGYEEIKMMVKDMTGDSASHSGKMFEQLELITQLEKALGLRDTSNLTPDERLRFYQNPLAYTGGFDKDRQDTKTVPLKGGDTIEVNISSITSTALEQLRATKEAHKETVGFWKEVLDSLHNQEKRILTGPDATMFETQRHNRRALELMLDDIHADSAFREKIFEQSKGLADPKTKKLIMEELENYNTPFGVEIKNPELKINHQVNVELSDDDKGHMASVIKKAMENSAVNNAAGGIVKDSINKQFKNWRGNTTGSVHR